MDENCPPTNNLVDRLTKMRIWIDSPHFPQEMRINMLNEPPKDLLQQFSTEEISVLKNLTKMLSQCPWNQESIGTCIVESAKSLEISPRIAYSVSYTCLMGCKKGPRLAPILAELNQRDIVNQLQNCCNLVN